MCIAGDDFVKCKYNTFNVVAVFIISNATDPATIVEVEQHDSVRFWTDKKISRSDILMSNPVPEV
ncbi:hypothetical protein RRF57_011078 [Xylaria bambusicola]|uniref:Uncharacterized protein n=1 Tax=Xylaria bambusicola TaxID=326684 RepID=A0AAN7UYZ6_9PEZI